MTTTTNTLAEALRNGIAAVQNLIALQPQHYGERHPALLELLQKEAAIRQALADYEAQAEAKPAPSQIVGALSWSCAVPWEVASWLSAHPPTIERAAPAAPAPEFELDPDDVLRLADLHADESLENGSRIFDRGGIWQFAKDLLAAAPAAPAPFDWPKLEQPAKVGAITFGNGVSTRHVVEAAQRQHERAQAEARLTPEDAQAAERARRDLWDMLNGAPAAPAPAEQWPSGIDIADEIDALLPVSMGYSTRAAVEAWWRDLVARKLCKVAAAPAPALCHNCAADGRCMKRQALCAANGTAPAAPAPEPMVVPQSGPCDHDFASGHEEGYAEGWNAAIEAMRGAAPAAPAQVPLTDERVAFEDWADPQELDLSQYLSADQSYVDSDTQAAWMAWQARAAIAASKGGADA